MSADLYNKPARDSLHYIVFHANQIYLSSLKFGPTGIAVARVEGVLGLSLSLPF
jgi:hypothetical protein